MLTKLILFVLFQSSTAVIRRLNASDYALLPPVFHLDNYEECFDSPKALYCVAEISLVSDEPSELLTMIREFSAYPLNYNRSLLRYGYCMHKTCKNFYNVSEGDLRLSLEACANESLYEKYKLKGIVSNNTDCSKRDREQPIDNLDISVGVICLAILLANLIGSLCDRYLKKGRDLAGLKFLLCFSIFGNWKKFVASPGDGRDPRLKTLKGINGIRALSMYMVVAAHSLFISVPLIVNPEKIESMYDITFYNIFSNGSLIMQTFLVLSSFLLVYNWLIDAEKNEISWNQLPQQIVWRWLRLTPSYALILGLTVTWFGRLASGPYWKKMIYQEISDCRHYWWKHLLYINNYTERSTCMPQTWYLAADTQLYCLAVIIFLMCRTSLTRKVVLSILFVVGIITPTLQVYYQELHGALLGHPEMAMSLFLHDPTFHYLYIKSHTYLTGCVIGMALGYIFYNWQKAGGEPNKLRKYRYLYWSLFLWVVLCWYSTSVYYQGGLPVPLYVELLLSLIKPIFGLIMALIIGGVIVQFEGLYRPILEWQPLVYLSRLSYIAYLLHIVFIKAELVSITATHRPTEIGTFLKSCTICTSTFIASFFIVLLVEIPFGNLAGRIFKRNNSHIKEDNKKAAEEFKKAEDVATDLGRTIIEDGAIVIKMGTTRQFSEKL